MGRELLDYDLPDLGQNAFSTNYKQQQNYESQKCICCMA